MQNKPERAKKRKKKVRRGSIIPYLVIILAAAALITVVVIVTNRGTVNPREVSVVELEKPVGTTAETARMVQDGNVQVAELVKRYLEAKKDANADALNQIVDSDAAFKQDSLDLESEYVEAYRNISCYTIRGYLENTYIVYVYYEQKFIGIESGAPSLLRFYVCTNEDGNLYIDMHKQDGEVAAYMEEVSGWEEVRSLIADVNQKFQNACAEDSALQDFVSRLQTNSLKQTDAGEGETTVSNGI